MKAVVGLACSILVFAAVQAAACPMQVTATPRPGGQSYEVKWTEVPGATKYDVFERRQGGPEIRLIREILADGEPPRFVASPSSTVRQTYEYLILAQGPNGTACMATKSFELPGDKNLGAITNKRIIPFAGSARGANGSDFRTALTLRFLPDTSGRIVFRPVGTLPSASDPSIRYEFGPFVLAAPDLHFDDIAAAMGVSGVGSIEIIPDVDPTLDIVYVPEAWAHIYNVTPDGTFGTHVPAVSPGDWIRNDFNNWESVIVPPATGNYRRNVGFRTLTAVRYMVSILYPGHAENGGFKELPAGITVFGSVEDLFGGPVPANARVTVRFLLGDAIGFYTETENTTNDPTLIVAEPREPFDVAWSY